MMLFRDDKKFGRDGVGDVQTSVAEPKTAIVDLDHLKIAEAIDLIGKRGASVAAGLSRKGVKV